MVTDSRQSIITTHAAWTALSALRSGSPVKSRNDIYSIIDNINFDDLLDKTAPSTDEEFTYWHKHATESICKRDNRFCTGWATKIINVYLKTAVYVGDLGTPTLRDLIHPPIDGGLWRGIEHRFKYQNPDIIARTHSVRRIQSITSYEIYSNIIDGCRLVAMELDCSLIEVEQLWDGGKSV